MAVEKKGMVIAIWTVCGVLFVAVVVLSFYLCYAIRHRRARSAYRQEHSCTDVTVIEKRFDGFTRLAASNLTTSPVAGTYTAPQIVHIGLSSAFQLTQGEACDILVNIIHVDNNSTAVEMGGSVLNNGCVSVLGHDDFYSGAFLLYTAPLQFVIPGVYVIRAHTVSPQEKTVGAVHQFVFTIVSSATGVTTTTSGNMFGLTVAPHSQNTTTDITLNRALELAQQPQQLTVGSSAAANTMAHQPPAVYRDATAGTLVFAAPPAPQILPHLGVVTTTTPIIISPHESSTSADQIRYSVDGSYPNILYTGPFTFALPPAPGDAHKHGVAVKIRAIAVAGEPFSSTTTVAARAAAYYHSPAPGERVSAVSEAVLEVRPAGYSYFDPSINAPSVKLRASGAMLYFDESQNPRGTKTCYQLLSISDARAAGWRGKAQYSRRRALIYDGNPIPISEDVALIHAWTVDGASLMRAGGGAADHSGLVRSDDDEDDCYGAPSSSRGFRQRSVATIYDCSRAATEHAKPSRKRAAQGEALLPPPVVCVSCKETDVMFDTPAANSVIAYTLNDREPALVDVDPPACAASVDIDDPDAWRRRLQSKDGQSDSSSYARGDPGGYGTMLYKPGTTIQVTRLEAQEAVLTARVFIPIREGPGAAGVVAGAASGALIGYRYGPVFRRAFYFQGSK